MALANENASVVNRAGQTLLEDSGLQTSLQEVFDVERKNIIELVLRLVQNAIAER